MLLLSQRRGILPFSTLSLFEIELMSTFSFETGLIHSFFYPPSSGIASYVGTAGMPCCVALGQVLIWVMSPDWFEELYTNNTCL